MKYKVKFARIVNEAQLVEGIIEADNLEAANEKFHQRDFTRFLVVKRDARDVTSVGDPSFERVA